MSLIYKALEKAQQEKAKDEAPQPAAGAQPSREEPLITVPAPRVLRVPVAAAVSLAGVLFCALYFYLHPDAVTSFVSRRHPAPVSPAVSEAQKEVPAQAAVRDPDSASATTVPVPAAAPVAAMRAPVVEVRTVPAAPQEVRAAEPALPAAAASAPPDIKISGIISDETSSLVIINGKVMSEGESVANGVFIKKIYKDSVVVESAGKEYVIKK